MWFYLPSTNRKNPFPFFCKMVNAARVMSANDGSPLGPGSRSASKSIWEYANNPVKRQKCYVSTTLCDISQSPFYTSLLLRVNVCATYEVIQLQSTWCVKMYFINKSLCFYSYFYGACIFLFTLCHEWQSGKNTITCKLIDGEANVKNLCCHKHLWCYVCCIPTYTLGNTYSFTIIISLLQV